MRIYFGDKPREIVWGSDVEYGSKKEIKMTSGFFI